MPVKMFSDFMALAQGRRIAKFQGADVECLPSLAENQIEFQNEVEPVLERFNGRFALNGREWKRVNESTEPNIAATTAPTGQGE